MNKLISFLSSVLLCCACSEQYNIAGNSSVPTLDGRMLYLRVTSEDMPMRDMAAVSIGNCLDSCKVVHGRFNFVGDVDSAMMAMLYTGSQCVMPLVIENGNLSIQVDNVGQRVSGGPLNDKLYKFFQKKNRLDNEMWELQQMTLRMMRDGASPEEIDKKVGKKARKLTEKSEEIETQFVIDNCDNVLGPGFFMMLCSQYPTPIMTEQIERIAKTATPAFLHHPYVSSYLQQARSRMEMQRRNAPTGKTYSPSFSISYP